MCANLFVDGCREGRDLKLLVLELGGTLYIDLGRYDSIKCLYTPLLWGRLENTQSLCMYQDDVERFLWKERKRCGEEEKEGRGGNLRCKKSFMLARR